MRRFFARAAIMALAAAVPISAFGGDREIASEIITSLKAQRDSGVLKGFTLDLKVEDGNVLFLGEVADIKQQQAVLKAAEGVEGVKNVVNQLSVKGQSDANAASAIPAAAKVPAAGRTTAEEGQFSLKQALKKSRPGQPIEVTNPDSQVAQASAEKQPATDAEVTARVEQQLQSAMQAGQLKGFGVAIDCENGSVWLKGRAASDAQKEMILQMVRATDGVQNVVDGIAVSQPAPLGPPQAIAHPGAAADLQLPRPPLSPGPDAAPQQPSPRNLKPVSVRDVSVAPVADRSAPPVQPVHPGIAAAPAPYRPQAGGVQATQAGMPMHAPGGAAVPAAYPGAYPGTVGVGYAAPRYEQPYMPNYAWPGYAAYPNYAAVTYPQQYSPSAWPYIGPFYPYPQVPLGWRKVSLEWDDGWWYLDFTDK